MFSNAYLGGKNVFKKQENHHHKIQRVVTSGGKEALWPGRGVWGASGVQVAVYFLTWMVTTQGLALCAYVLGTFLWTGYLSRSKENTGEPQQRLCCRAGGLGSGRAWVGTYLSHPPRSPPPWLQCWFDPGRYTGSRWWIWSSWWISCSQWPWKTVGSQCPLCLLSLGLNRLQQSKGKQGSNTEGRPGTGEVREPGQKYGILAGGWVTWASHFSTLSHSFLIWKMG